MKRFKIIPIAILLTLGGCTPKIEESSSSIESLEQWTAVADSDKAFGTLENALRPYLTDDKFGYSFMNVDESKPLITLDMESDEDLFASSSTPSSTKEMKGYTVELYGKGDVSMVNCTKEHAFKAANIFNANRMAVISGGSELTSIKQTFKTYIAENKKGETEEYEQGFYADLTQAAMSKFLVGQLLGKDDGIEEKTYTDISEIYRDSFVFADVMDRALPYFRDALNERYQKGNIAIEKNDKSVYRINVSIKSKEDLSSLIKNVIADALKTPLEQYLSSLTFDDYVDRMLEDVDTVEGNLTFTYTEEGTLGDIFYDFDIAMKKEEPSSSEEEPSDFFLKSVSFEGNIALKHGSDIKEDIFPNDFLDHNVWKELDY